MSGSDLIIFGAGDIAQLACHYFRSDSPFRPKAFTVDGAYLKEDHFEGLPVVPFEELADRFPAQDYRCFVALSYSGLNGIRRGKYEACKAMGYEMASYVSSRASVLTQYPIGENAFILEDNTIQPFVRIGDNVTLWSGNHIGHHSRIGGHVFVSSHVVVSGGVTIEEQCFIGVNATLRDHITVGARCVVGAGALLLADAEQEGVYLSQATERSRVPSTRLRKI